MSKGRFLGVLIPNLDEFFGSPPLGAYMRGEGGEGGEKVTFFFFDQYHHVGCLNVGFWGY